MTPVAHPPYLFLVPQQHIRNADRDSPQPPTRAAVQRLDNIRDRDRVDHADQQQTSQLGVGQRLQQREPSRAVALARDLERLEPREEWRVWDQVGHGCFEVQADEARREARELHRPKVAVGETSVCIAAGQGSDVGQRALEEEREELVAGLVAAVEVECDD